jgi:hypothetical protein
MWTNKSTDSGYVLYYDGVAQYGVDAHLKQPAVRRWRTRMKSYSEFKRQADAICMHRNALGIRPSGGTAKK